jgi:hypothetical protein
MEGAISNAIFVSERIRYGKKNVFVKNEVKTRNVRSIYQPKLPESG